MQMEYLKLSKVLFKKTKFERERRRHVQNVQLDKTLDHYNWNGLDTVQYEVILGDFEQLANIVPKKKYSLVIVNIPHGYNIENIGYDIDPYSYQDFNKVVMGFTEVTTSPFFSSISFRHTTRISTIKLQGERKDKDEVYLVIY
jgi:hypothetical protein